MMVGQCWAVEPASLRAAAYIRMSTRSQCLSPQLQREFLSRYADAHGMQIVRCYVDEGRSGLQAEGRPGFLQLLSDLAGGTADFRLLLVYDVSRWGRYQNVDAAGYYEFLCTLAGVRVLYCAEAFLNDGTPAAQLMKSVKRSMAAEWSRALSEKVFAGQHRLALQGYKQGGAATFGLRRVAVAPDGSIVRELLPGERKPHPHDRVRLTPGSEAEQAVVRRIYHCYNQLGWTMRAIARQLNSEGIDCGGSCWNDYRVKSVLSKPQYWGCQVYNRTSSRLHAPVVHNPPAQWVCAGGAIAPMVSAGDSARAQQIRHLRNGDDPAAVLEGLRSTQAQHGRLSHALLKQVPGMPGARRLRRMFGSLAAASDAAGITQPCWHQPCITPARRVSLGQALCERVVTLAARAGGEAEFIPSAANQLRINHRLSLRVTVLCCTPGGARQRWRLNVRAGPISDFILAGLLDAEQRQFVRFALVATAQETRALIHFGSGRYASSRGLLFSSLAAVFGLCDRAD